MELNEVHSSVSLALLFFWPFVLWKEMPRRTDFVQLFISEERTNLLSCVVALFPIIGFATVQPWIEDNLLYMGIIPLHSSTVLY